MAEWGDNWRSTIPVDELFEIVVDSSAVQLRKPDPAIYVLTCERIGVAPEAAVFLDDNHDNIAAARSLGMETVTVGEDPFVAVAELDEILARRGMANSGLTRPTPSTDRARSEAEGEPRRSEPPLGSGTEVRAETPTNQLPAIVISATSSVTPAVPPGSQVRSAPTSTTSCSIRGSVDATRDLAYRLGELPVAHHQALGPHREVAAHRVRPRVQAGHRLHVERLGHRRPAPRPRTWARARGGAPAHRPPAWTCTPAPPSRWSPRRVRRAV